MIVLDSGDLEQLMRNKGLQARYDEWMMGMKGKYGSTGESSRPLPYSPTQSYLLILLPPPSIRQTSHPIPFAHLILVLPVFSSFLTRPREIPHPSSTTLEDPHDRRTDLRPQRQP